jgi:GNAT superfamily N-acetyltransferase
LLIGNGDVMTEAEIVVRPAGERDIPGMCDLLYELFSIEADFIPDRPKQEKGLRMLLERGSGTSLLLVAQKGSDVVGMCSVQVVISTVEGGPVGIVEDLIVRRENRGKGIGGRLLSEVGDWCIARGVSRLQLLRDRNNADALSFYAADGWSGTDLVCMRKMLAPP